MTSTQGQPPFIKTPLTDVGALLGLIDVQLKEKPLCKKFELKYFNCLEAYGMEKGVDKCAEIYEDLLECKFCEKQQARLQKIKSQLDKQVKEGKRTYSKPPELDSAFPLNF